MHGFIVATLILITALCCTRLCTTMSLEDLSVHFESDESDDEAKNLRSYGESEDDGSEVNYQDLVCLHDNLMNFENIYLNNAVIDMEVRLF